MSTEQLMGYPNLRRFFESGFAHNPLRDAPQHGMICLESVNQRLFVVPETGYLRVGRTLAQ